METALKQKVSLQEESREYFTEEFLGEDEDKYDDFINKMNLNIRYIQSLLDEIRLTNTSKCPTDCSVFCVR